MSLAESLRTVLEVDPAPIAIDDLRDPLSWGEVRACVEQIETLLDEAGIGVGRPVGLLLRNRAEMVAAILAMIVSQRCIVCVNPLQGELKLLDDVGSLKVAALIACEEDWASEALRETAAQAGSFGIRLARDESPAVLRVPGLERVGPGPHRPAAPDVAVEMLTSGTTGPPKRILLRADAFEAAILGASHYESREAKAPVLKRGFTLLSSPLVHIGGMFHAVKSAIDGRPLCLLERFTVDGWVEAMRRHRPKVTGLVPAAMKMVIDAEVPVEDLSSLLAVRSGTAALAPELQARFEERYGIPVLPTYGATEFAGAVAGWTLADHRDFIETKRGSVGRAHPGCKLRIVEPESGDPLGVDERGLLEVESDHNPSAGWVRTSDYARIDADGFVWIEGRADGAINRGGFKVDPATVARALERHPAIREAAVVGIPDDRLGEVPVAAYELRSGQTAPDEEELRAFAREHLTAYFVPTRFLAVEALPRTPSLKPSLPALRSLFEAN